MFHKQAFKFGMTLLLSAALFTGSSSAFAQSSSSISSETLQVTALGKAFQVNVVRIDLTDPTLELAPAVAKGGIGHDEDFVSMIERERAAAAVNGTFFSAYESNPYNRFPNGTLLDSGELVHSGENQKLSNALVVRKLDKPKVQIEINDRYVPDFHGFILKDTTLVPIRPFITSLKAGFQWDAATRTAVITSGKVTLKLRDGSSTAEVNGKPVSIPVPLQILEDSRMYVPLRLVSETLGAAVQWDQRLYRASVKLP